MNKFITLSALRLIPKSKQNQIFIKSINYLASSLSDDLQKHKDYIYEFELG